MNEKQRSVALWSIIGTYLFIMLFVAHRIQDEPREYDKGVTGGQVLAAERAAERAGGNHLKPLYGAVIGGKEQVSDTLKARWAERDARGYATRSLISELAVCRLDDADYNRDTDTLHAQGYSAQDTIRIVQEAALLEARVFIEDHGATRAKQLLINKGC